MSFGLVACVLGLVLGLCFARELLVSGEAPDWVVGRPGPPGVGTVVVRAPAPRPLPLRPGAPSGGFSQGSLSYVLVVRKQLWLSPAPRVGLSLLSMHHTCPELWAGRAQHP